MLGHFWHIQQINKDIFQTHVSGPRIYITNSDEKTFYPKMRNEQDRTGVIRRQLFQVVQSDVRVGKAIPAPTPMVTAMPRAGSLGDWKGLLEAACQDSHVSHHFTRACAVCEQLGVISRAEVLEVAVDIADMVGMKLLERRRFLGLVRD